MGFNWKLENRKTPDSLGLGPPNMNTTRIVILRNASSISIKGCLGFSSQKIKICNNNLKQPCILSILFHFRQWITKISVFLDFSSIGIPWSYIDKKLRRLNQILWFSFLGYGISKNELYGGARMNRGEPNSEGWRSTNHVVFLLEIQRSVLPRRTQVFSFLFFNHLIYTHSFVILGI